MDNATPLKNCRLNDPRKLTQEQVAETLGIFPTYYSEIESGRRRPGLGLLMRITSFWGISLEAALVGFNVDGTSKSKGNKSKHPKRLTINRN